MSMLLVLLIVVFSYAILLRMALLFVLLSIEMTVRWCCVLAIATSIAIATAITVVAVAVVDAALALWPTQHRLFLLLSLLFSNLMQLLQLLLLLLSLWLALLWLIVEKTTGNTNVYGCLLLWTCVLLSFCTTCQDSILEYSSTQYLYLYVIVLLSRVPTEVVVLFSTVPTGTL